MKKQNILIALLSIAALVACGQQPSGKSEGESTPGSEPGEQADLVINDFGTVRIEAEDFDLTYWEPDESYDGENIIEENAASGGAYLAAADPAGSAEASFSFELKKDSRVVVSAAYAQIASQINTQIDMAKTYHYSIENVSPLSFASGKNMLGTRSSATSWELMPYIFQDLDAGIYHVTLTLESDVERCPSIDYLQFKTSDSSFTPVDPSTITEADIPDNDMRNLNQYKYLMDEDIYNYKTYGNNNNNDYSVPRGMKLKYDDVETGSKYYVQVAESEEGLASAKVRESNEKYYYFQNAKLATKYYYRAATSEAALSSAKVYDITSTSQAPRVVSVPDVLNFRDIGGWESTLVPGAKVKQGLYFRCAQLDAAQGTTKSCLDSEGKGLEALKELGIKLDIDMRDKNNQPNSGNGPSKTSTTDWPIDFLSVAVPSGSEPVRWEGGTYQGTDIAAQYVKIFNALANCDEKPAMLHCTYGADRTGIASFFLEALIGMNMEDMIRDYLWTQFAKGRNVKILESEGAEFPQWVSKTNACEGDNFADKMENHLISFGIEKATLEHIREIFVPGYVAKA